jgi:hypothetical protein
LEKCIDQLKENKWVIVSLRQIREILQQFPEQVSGGGGGSSTFQTHRLLNTYPQSASSNQSNSNMLLLNSSSTSHHHNTCFHRTDIIAKLQKEYSLISMITANLADYYDAIRKSVVGSAATSSSSLLQDPENIHPDGRFSHCTQVQERLNFLKYLLKEGQLWLCANQAETIWKCLAQNSVFELDREICFKWFSKLMTDDPDLEPDMNKTFFVNYIIK